MICSGLGTCASCGNLCEVEDIELTMTRRESRYRSTSEKFHAALCETCQRKVFCLRRNSLLAFIIGICCAFLPFLWTPRIGWSANDHLAWLVPALFAGVVLSLVSLSRGDGRPLQSDVSYQLHADNGYHLQNNLMRMFLKQAVFAYALLALIVWTVVLGLLAYEIAIVLLFRSRGWWE